MKRMALYTLLLTLVVYAHGAGSGSHIQPISAHFKMEILEDDVRREATMLVELTIVPRTGRQAVVVWDHVYVNPIHERKVVVLKAEHFSTAEDSIRNVQLTENAFSFTIAFSGTFGGAGRTVQVVGEKKPEALVANMYDVSATGLWYSSILNRKIKTEWRTTSEKVILPYKEVF